MSPARILGGRGRQDWRTPPWLIRLLEGEVGPFDLDGAATAENAVCKHWIGPEQDALSVEKVGTLRVFLNPPYGRGGGGLSAWVETAIRWWGWGAEVVALLPASTGSRWFGRVVETADEVRLIRPRLPFLDAEGRPARSNIGDSLVAFWRRQAAPPGGFATIRAWDLSAFVRASR